MQFLIHTFVFLPPNLILKNTLLHLSYTTPCMCATNSWQKTYRNFIFICILEGFGNKLWLIYREALQSPFLRWKSSLFAYWLWSCVVTVLILLTKYWRPLVVTLLNYFLHLRSISSACRICLHGWSKHFTSSYDPSTPHSILNPKSMYNYNLSCQSKISSTEVLDCYNFLFCCLCFHHKEKTLKGASGIHPANLHRLRDAALSVHYTEDGVVRYQEYWTHNGNNNGQGMATITMLMLLMMSFS